MYYTTACQKCQKELPLGSSFCPQCGTPVASIYGKESEKTVSIFPAFKSLYLPKGTVLKNRYRINRMIGRGGFGITYDGTDLQLQMHVAVKEFFPGQIADRSAVDPREVTCSSTTAHLFKRGMDNFLKEARNMAKFVGQENFISVHDYFFENSTAYIIMEYVEGQNLKNYMKMHGHFTMDATMTIITPIMSALEKIHEAGMIHRDVSPSNIMVLPTKKVKLLDFGAVTDISEDEQILTTMSAVYKKGYSPIEQQTLDLPQGTYSDIYALCATIYEMLTGTVPPSPFARLSGEELLVPPSKRGVELSPSQEKGILKGLEIHGKDRIQTIGELRSALNDGGKHTILSSHIKGILITASIIIVSLAFILGRLTSTTHPDSSPQLPESEAQATDNTVQNNHVERTTADSTVLVSQPVETQNTPNKISSQGTELTDKSETWEQEDAEESEAAGQIWEEAKETENVGQSQGEAELSKVIEQEPVQEEKLQKESYFDYPESALSFGGHHYYIYNDGDMSWDAAMDRCLERGGYLAVINDANENEAIYQYLVDMGFEQAFFGLCLQDDGSWGYIAGDTSEYRDWGVNSNGEQQPNNNGVRDKHAMFDILMHDGHWNDSLFGRKAYTSTGARYRDIYVYLCEWDG